jgi:hypothetical protein
LAASTLITNETEFHAEALGHRGDKGSRTLTLSAVTGTRTQFSDESLLSAELLYFSDGDSKEQYRRRLQLIERLKNLPVAAPENGGQSGKLLRKWYGSIGLQNYKLVEDLFAGVPLLVNLHDGSGVITPRLTWGPEQWLSLSASISQCFETSQSTVEGVKTKHTSEFQLSPFARTYTAEIKAFF